MYIAQNKLHISKGNSKIGKIANLNLLCGDDNLNGRTDVIGSCCGCCDSCKDRCYGRKSYRYLSPLMAHADNTKYARTELDEFFTEISVWIAQHKPSYFRFHSHGEILNKDYLLHMLRVAYKFPNTKFYVYTKRYTLVNQVLDEISLPNNLTILFSPPFTCKDSLAIHMWVKKNNPHKLPMFIVDDGTHPLTETVYNAPHCPAVDRKGKHTGITCDKCQRCIKGLTTVVYAH